MRKHDVPWLTLLAVSLCTAASAADSNRVAGALEPGSNWIRVKFTAENGQAYWCHASDCLAGSYKGTSRNVNAPATYTGVDPNGGFDPSNVFAPPKTLSYSRLTGAPLFALIPYKDPLVGGSATAYKAVRSRWSVSEVRFDQAGKTTSISVDAGWSYPSQAQFDPKDTLSAGDVVVADADTVETGKPMDLGVPEVAAAGGCTPGSYAESYPSGDGGKLYRDFAPIEYLMERAGFRSLSSGHPINAMVSHGSTASNGQKFDSVAADVARGNLSVAEDYALALHAGNVGVAKVYLAATPAANDALTPEEQRFLGCLAGVAGDTQGLQKAIVGASGNPQDFTASARSFLRAELKRYVDAADHFVAGHYPAWPPPPSKLDLDSLDWSGQWNGLATDARNWIDKRASPPTSAFALPGRGVSVEPSQPVVARHPVAPPPSGNQRSEEELEGLLK